MESYSRDILKHWLKMQTKQLIFCYGADIQNCVLCSTTKLEAFAAVLIIRWNTDAAGTDEVFKKIGVNCGSTHILDPESSMI